MAVETIQWLRGRIKLIDQTKLPKEIKFIYCDKVSTLIAAIKRLSVRGAPALGVAAAFGVLLAAEQYKDKGRAAFDKYLWNVCKKIAASRPTAVNLFAGLDQMKSVLSANKESSVADLKRKLRNEAFRIFEEDKNVCRKMGAFGARLVKNNANLMTVCNAGALATVDYGTALGVFYSAKAKKKKFKVYACETRPLLQGARLTTWELIHENIDTTLICDNMAATLMKQGAIDAIFTGADRIAANGDTANKIGTYNLAVLAHYHKVSFYIVAPRSTFDLSLKTGKEIPIEQRGDNEVKKIRGVSIAPSNVKVFNPAFDVTDAKLITAIVTEVGIIKPPFRLNIRKKFK